MNQWHTFLTALDRTLYANRWVYFLGDSTLRQVTGEFLSWVSLDKDAQQINFTDFDALKKHEREACTPRLEPESDKQLVMERCK